MANILRSITRQDLVFRTSVGLCIISFLLVLSLTMWHQYDKRQVVDSAKDNATQTALDAANGIATVLGRLPTLAHSIADDLSTGRLSDDGLEQRLIRELELNQGLGAVTVCYVPEFVPEAVAQGSRKLYCPYSYTNAEGTVYIERVEDYYDYTKPDGSMIGPAGTPIRTAWYHRPLIEGPSWGEPFFGSDHTNYWGGFGAPFYRNDPSGGGRTLAGTVDVSLTLGRFQDLVSGVDLGKPGAGYGFIISHTGAFVYHPIVQFIEGEQTISDFDSSLSIDVLRQMADRSPDEEILVVDHLDQKSARSSWLFFAPITPSGWWVGIVLNRDTILRGGEIVRHLRYQQTGIAMGILAFLFFLSVILFRADRGTARGLWAVSASFSILSVAGIAYLWHVNLNGPPGELERDVVLAEEAITEKVVADYVNEIPNLILVPTGVLIESLDFTSAHNVLLTGYIWQKYAPDIPEWIIPVPDAGSPGFVLPQADISYKSDVFEVYRYKDGEDEVIGWYFRASLRQQVDYSEYPFHREDIRMRIWHKDFAQGVLLTPDLVSYTRTSPEAFPGVDLEDFVLEGWRADYSLFSFREATLTTDFGVLTSGAPRKSPELFFHIGLTRRFMDAFVSHLIPLIIVAALLFAVLLIVTVRQERIGRFGFSTAGVLAYCAALFFVVIVLHISLRSGLEAPAVILYLEYFYFEIYAAILLVSMDSILLTSDINVPFVEYRENLLVNLVYWPLMTGVLLIVSLFVFL